VLNLVSAVAHPDTGVPVRADLEIALLTGCKDRPYAFGLATALASNDVAVEFVGSDDLDSPELHKTPGLRFLSLQGRKKDTGLAKVWKLLTYYGRLVSHAVTSPANVFHVLWNNRLEYVDRTLLMLLYKAQGKKIVLTAHNVNQRKRDSNDTFFNRLTLKSQYRLVDHIFVHTQKMKQELMEDFQVPEPAVTVLRHPINDAFPDTSLTPAEAKLRLGIKDGERTLLFLGRITPYKGLEYLLEAFQQLGEGDDRYRLIIAGQTKKGTEQYSQDIDRLIRTAGRRDQIIFDNQFIPDEKMELYLKGADVLVLPYTDIFQSGVLFLGFTFGLPAIASDVGSFHEDVVENRTGLLFRPRDSADLARAIDTYFSSDLYNHLSERREDIRKYFRQHHSWDAVAQVTRNVYAQLMRH
jgi:D-inositol-3-phosphate glycosyltransferase